MEHAHVLTSGVDHVGLTVTDIALSREFFVSCLGWKVVGENLAYPAVFVSDGAVRLTLWQVDKTGDYAAFNRRKNIGLHHLALKVTSNEKLLDLFVSVSRWPGVVVEFAPEPLGQGATVHFMVLEPGGVRMEFVYTPAM